MVSPRDSRLLAHSPPMQHRDDPCIQCRQKRPHASHLHAVFVKPLASAQKRDIECLDLFQSAFAVAEDQRDEQQSKAERT